MSPYSAEPAHVHVTGPGQVKVDLLGPGGAPEVIYSVGVKTGDLRRLLQVVVEHRDEFLLEWETIHGPVR